MLFLKVLVCIIVYIFGVLVNIVAVSQNADESGPGHDDALGLALAYIMSLLLPYVVFIWLVVRASFFTKGP